MAYSGFNASQICQLLTYLRHSLTYSPDTHGAPRFTKIHPKLLGVILFANKQNLAPCGTDGRLLLNGFQLLMTLTLHRVIRHTVVHRSSTSIYIPNFIEIRKTFFVDGLTAGTAPSSRSRDTKLGQISKIRPDRI